MNKILIVGESNSVMKGGWVQGFVGSCNNGVVVNRSIGSTGILNAIHQIVELKDEFYEFDIVLLDHLINDVKFYINDQERYFKYLGVFYSMLVSSGIKIIEVAYSRHDLNDAGGKFLCKIIDFIKARKIEVYDVRDKLLEIKERDGLENLSSLYRDSAHPQPQVSYEIGCDLAVNLNSLEGGVVERKKSVLPFKILDVDFISANGNVLAESFKLVKNSLVNYKLVDISVDTPLEINIPPALEGSSVIGFMFNASKATGFCSFETLNNKVDKLVSNGNYLKDNPVLWARPIHTDFFLEDVLEIKAINHSLHFESTEFCGVKYESTDDSRMELVSLILMC
ncbi:hypothetical protein [Vreelandella titanicae]|uniref:hypothetical protein n=1 Tax=Vreelandella titanicae TaxID=664683 RepID=UPI0039BFC418